MDTQEIYEKYIMQAGFNKMKSLRNQWSNKDIKYGLRTIVDIGSSDYSSYRFTMDRCTENVYEMIQWVVIELLRAYKIPFKYIKLTRNDAHVYIVNDNIEPWKDFVEQSNRRPILAFIKTEADREILYIFKEYGIGNRLPESLLQKIAKDVGVKHYRYISVVEDDAFSEVLNHNDNKDDPSRGTGIYSLKFFFEKTFGKDEYEKFKKYTDLFTKEVRDYFGFSIVKTLKPNTLYNFKKTVRENILEFDISKLDADNRLSYDQREYLRKRFIEDNLYELLVGKSDFAQSFMTAEWLYDSLSDAGNIDLTAIAMGYFKAVEQILFKYICLHTAERDGGSRQVYVGKGKPYADNRGNADLTNSLVDDEEKTKDINLGSLTGFFGFNDVKNGRRYGRNKDLLRIGVSEGTYEFIVDTFTAITGLRNGYFHKHNLTDQHKVDEARDNAFLVFYLLLGAYMLSKSEQNEMGIIHANVQDDYYRLCAYLNKRAYLSDPMRIPIYYMNGEKGPYGFFMGYQDDFIKYDEYGEAVFSGAYFKRMEDKNHIIKANKENLPEEIWEGELVISASTPIQITPSGPLVQLYKDGKFCVEE